MSPAACGGTSDMELVTTTDRPFPVAVEGQMFASTEACGYSFFGCRWCGIAEVSDRRCAASPGEQEVYKARSS